MVRGSAVARTSEAGDRPRLVVPGLPPAQGAESFSHAGVTRYPAGTPVRVRAKIAGARSARVPALRRQRRHAARIGFGPGEVPPERPGPVWDLRFRDAPEDQRHLALVLVGGQRRPARRLLVVPPR